MPNFLGLHLQLLLGPTDPRPTPPTPAPLKVNEALESLEVTLKDKDQSGFQLVFQIGRSAVDVKDYALLKEPKIKPFNRVVISVLFGIKPLPIIDGIITNHQLQPGSDPGTSKLTLMGKDISMMLDLEQKAETFCQEPEPQIVRRIVTRELADYRVSVEASSVENAQVLTAGEQPLTQDRKSTHLGYIKKLADRFGYVFFIEPGELPGTNVAYWGPPPRRGPAQSALSINMGPNTNIESISFKYDESAPTRIRYEPAANTEDVPISEFSRQPRLAARVPRARRLEFLDLPDGLTDREARRTRAQGKVDESYDRTVTATGTLDALRYGRILRPRSLLDVRGAGEHFSGTYYVREVTHKIDVRKGEYKQTFSLAREGVGRTSPVVTP